MAQRVVVEVTDDLDGSPAEEKVRFGLDGMTYEIDLNAAHAGELRDALATYIGFARKDPKGNRPPVRVEVEVDANAVRAWARANDVELGPRGRIPADVIARFEQSRG